MLVLMHRERTLELRLRVRDAARWAPLAGPVKHEGGRRLGPGMPRKCTYEAQRVESQEAAVGGALLAQWELAGHHRSGGSKALKSYRIR